MTNQRVEIITSVERRRRWSDAEKERLVAASLEPGASVSAVARQAGIHPGQLYGWRRRFRAPAAFASVQVMAETTPVGPANSGTIEIEFAAGIRMRIKGAVDAATLAAVITALTQHVWEKFSCRHCETISQPPAPFHAIARGFAGPSLLAMILVDKYADLALSLCRG